MTSDEITIAACKTIWDRSPRTLEREYGDFGSYCAFVRHERAGHVAIAHQPRVGLARRSSPLNETILRSYWDANPAGDFGASLQEEFGGDFETYKTFKEHEAAGHINLVAHKPGAARG